MINRKLKFVIAPDSFKGSLSSSEVCHAMEAGIREVFSEVDILKIPMADGGEGTVEALVQATKGKLFTTEVIGSYGQKVEANYGILGDGETGVIEMASASGLQHIIEGEANPLLATTFGTGQLIKKLLDKGIEKIIMGLGGSATNDGGAGMATALGVKFLDEKGQRLPLGGGQLARLSDIDMSGLDKRLSSCSFELASDVTNPLCGENGASFIFGPQKGATPEMVMTLDTNLFHFSEVIKTKLGKDIKDMAGAGAAGGLGAGMMAFTDAEFQSGVELIIKYTGLLEAVRGADFVITGEGKIDSQTKFGKTPLGVCQAAKSVKENVEVIAVAGVLGSGYEELYKEGFTAIFPIISKLSSLDELLADAYSNVKKTAKSIAQVIKAGMTVKKEKT